MNVKTMQKVALRHRAVFLPLEKAEIPFDYQPTAPLMAFVARLKENGYTVSEELLHALAKVPTRTLVEVTEVIREALGIDLNWAPLVKGWDVPTGETYADHLITLVVNLFGGKQAGFKGVTMPCGHFIPEGTFPIERYNGCPFCGTPFRTANFVYHGQGSKLKELRLFTLADMEQLFRNLLQSPTPLDATQLDSLKLLLGELELPENVEIPMKETLMVVISGAGHTAEGRKAVEKQIAVGLRYLKSPTDILRYFWYEKTGMVKVIEPKYLVEMERKAQRHRWAMNDQSEEKAAQKRQALKLQYDRKHCRMAATWLNALPMDARKAAEEMHPKRGMWVRLIHALRLGEYSRRKGFEPLAQLLDVFYKQDYEPWMGKVEKARRDNNTPELLRMLCQRPGLFARCLFATMLRFGKDETLNAFERVSDTLPARLVLSLGNAADAYFDLDQIRIARPITGGTHPVQPNALLSLYSEDQRKAMVNEVNNLYANTMRRRFAAAHNDAKTIYIDPRLYEIPVSIGDRSTTVQDTSCALQGTRFPVEGDAVRLFLQWGKGLPAQPLDMDLSCHIAFNNGVSVECAYFNLTAPGAKHSGDIRSIPNQVGTAEYIELSLPELQQAGAKFVVFPCNAYTSGNLSPNLMVGWMDSAYPMTISEENGVAYDPSCVQHIVRVSEGNLSKGLVFGVLKVEEREIVWLEMPFMGQTVHDLDTDSVEAMLRRLEEKLSVGALLDLKREGQDLILVTDPQLADEAYTYEWALDPAAVSALLNAE